MVSKNTAYVLDMSGIVDIYRYHGNIILSLKITVGGKTGEGRRVLARDTRWTLGLGQ